MGSVYRFHYISSELLLVSKSDRQVGRCGQTCLFADDIIVCGKSREQVEVWVWVSLRSAETVALPQ